jgi:putative intracellular protease/amidase
MYDLATDEDSQALIREFWESGKVVGAICHGSAALLNVKLSDGSHLVADAPVTGFSNAEEDMIKLSQYLPFMLETELDNRTGGGFEKAESDWASHVAVAKGGRLITGQNPASSEAWGKAILGAI